MPTERFNNPNTRKTETRPIVTKEQAENAKSTVSISTTKSKNLGAKSADANQAPKKKDDQTNEEWLAEVGRWRRARQAQ